MPQAIHLPAPALRGGGFAFPEAEERVFRPRTTGAGFSTIHPAFIVAGRAQLLVSLDKLQPLSAGGYGNSVVILRGDRLPAWPQRRNGVHRSEDRAAMVGIRQRGFRLISFREIFGGKVAKRLTRTLVHGFARHLKEPVRSIAKLVWFAGRHSSRWN